jgi:hypothetical protein
MADISWKDTYNIVFDKDLRESDIKVLATIDDVELQEPDIIYILLEASRRDNTALDRIMDKVHRIQELNK